MHKLLKYTILGATIVAVTALLLLFFYAHVSLIFIITFVIVWGAIVYFVIDVNSWIKTYLCPADYPNNIWYRKHLERNYDAIILGDGTIDVTSQVGEGKLIFNFALHNQTILWDFKVLKHFFSILKPNGTVIIPISNERLMVAENDVDDKRPYMFDFMPYIFTKSHIKGRIMRAYKFIPILLLRFKDLPFYFLHKIGKETYPSPCYKLSDPYKVTQLFEEILQFCKERDLRIVFMADSTLEERWQQFVNSKGIVVEKL